MPIPASGTFTSGTCITEWALSVPMTSAGLATAAGVGAAYTSETLRGKGKLASATLSAATLSNHEVTFDSYATSEVSGSSVSAVSGALPLTYAWTRQSGNAGITCSGGINPTFSFSGNTPFDVNATWRCRVTDNVGDWKDTGNVVVTLSASDGI